MKKHFTTLLALVITSLWLAGQAPSPPVYSDVITLGAGTHMAVVGMLPETFTVGWQHYLPGRQTQPKWFVGGRLQLGWESRSELQRQTEQDNISISEPVRGLDRPFVFAEQIAVPADPGLVTLQDRESTTMEFYLDVLAGKRWQLGPRLMTSLSTGIGLNYTSFKSYSAADYFAIKDPRFEQPERQRIRNHQQAYLSMIDYAIPVHWQVAGIVAHKYLLGAELSTHTNFYWGTTMYFTLLFGRQF